ncbi:uncharacterized protein [Dendropsophus ebraccatus]|uniref:uncharacterized protein n=1 Tax=Dendropsophus ebraccatus TaxID=150705 RepID=UPI00383169E6
MKQKSFVRKNWFWVAGAAFLGIHFGTYIIQKVAKSSARDNTAIKDTKGSD